MSIVVLYFGYLLTGLWWALFARVVLSWIAALAPGNPFTSSRNPVTHIILQITDPILIPLRRIIPPVGMFDLSPMVAFFLIYFLLQIVQRL